MKTVDSILKTFSRAITDLDNLIKDGTKQYDKLNGRIVKLEVEATGITSEIEKAKIARSNISNLLTTPTVVATPVEEVAE